ncbi:MAG TPA: hypothetical protein VFY29_05525 [Terriglobia bacterium]|nr:hypothetical protein [Terriglobia bacterium]
MAKTERALSINNPVHPETAVQPLLILEKLLMDTMDLRWHVLHATVRADDAVSRKTLALFERMASELKVFTDRIRRRLEFWRMAGPRAEKGSQRPYLHVIDGEDLNIHEQLEALLCGYARYERNIQEARISLERSGDMESVRLCDSLMGSVERALCYLEIYLEGLALNYTDPGRLPDFPVVSVDA